MELNINLFEFSLTLRHLILIIIDYMKLFINNDIKY